MNILVAVMQFLSEDARTDRRTNRYGELAVCHLKLIIEKVLRNIVTLAAQPVVL